MTIIIQHQYWALKVKEEYFEVTLTFKKLPAPLHIPFSALTAFFDPGVQFGLQFRSENETQKSAPAPVAVPSAPPEPHAEAPEPVGPKPAPAADKAGPGEVVSLDSFRKK
jgi:hypothetical protein